VVARRARDVEMANGSFEVRCMGLVWVLRLVGEWWGGGMGIGRSVRSLEWLCSWGKHTREVVVRENWIVLVIGLVVGKVLG
jgi:hypothetical protein